MRWSKFLLLLKFALFVSYVHAGGPSTAGHAPACVGSTPLPKGAEVASTRVKLRQRSEAPTFYLLVGEPWPTPRYAIQMSVEDVLGELEKGVPAPPSHWDKMMVEQIQRDQPLQRDTDLRHYGLSQWRLRGIPEMLAASLLGSGKAVVLDLWGTGENEALEAVQVSRVGISGSRYLEVCRLSGEPIFSVTLSIAN